MVPGFFLFFFFNDPATTEIYTLSLHDVFRSLGVEGARRGFRRRAQAENRLVAREESRLLHRQPLDFRDAIEIDRKSTRLNSSHANISYAVFCLKKKKEQSKHYIQSDNSNA